MSTISFAPTVREMTSRPEQRPQGRSFEAEQAKGKELTPEQSAFFEKATTEAAAKRAEADRKAAEQQARDVQEQANRDRVGGDLATQQGSSTTGPRLRKSAGTFGGELPKAPEAPQASSQAVDTGAKGNWLSGVLSSVSDMFSGRKEAPVAPASEGSDLGRGESAGVPAASGEVLAQEQKQQTPQEYMSQLRATEKGAIPEEALHEPISYLSKDGTATSLESLMLRNIDTLNSLRQSLSNYEKYGKPGIPQIEQTKARIQEVTDTLRDSVDSYNAQAASLIQLEPQQQAQAFQKMAQVYDALAKAMPDKAFSYGKAADDARSKAYTIKENAGTLTTWDKIQKDGLFKTLFGSKIAPTQVAIEKAVQQEGGTLQEAKDLEADLVQAQAQGNIRSWSDWASSWFAKKEALTPEQKESAQFDSQVKSQEEAAQRNRIDIGKMTTDFKAEAAARVQAQAQVEYQAKVQEGRRILFEGGSIEALTTDFTPEERVQFDKDIRQNMLSQRAWWNLQQIGKSIMSLIPEAKPMPEVISTEPQETQSFLSKLMSWRTETAAKATGPAPRAKLERAADQAAQTVIEEVQDPKQKSGLRALWDRLTGRTAAIEKLTAAPSAEEQNTRMTAMTGLTNEDLDVQVPFTKPGDSLRKSGSQSPDANTFEGTNPMREKRSAVEKKVVVRPSEPVAGRELDVTGGSNPMAEQGRLTGQEVAPDVSRTPENNTPENQTSLWDPVIGSDTEPLPTGSMVKVSPISKDIVIKGDKVTNPFSMVKEDIRKIMIEKLVAQSNRTPAQEVTLQQLKDSFASTAASRLGSVDSTASDNSVGSGSNSMDSAGSVLPSGDQQAVVAAVESKGQGGSKVSISQDLKMVFLDKLNAIKADLSPEEKISQLNALRAEARTEANPQLKDAYLNMLQQDYTSRLREGIDERWGLDKWGLDKLNERRELLKGALDIVQARKSPSQGLIDFLNTQLGDVNKVLETLNNKLESFAVGKAGDMFNEAAEKSVLPGGDKPAVAAAPSSIFGRK